MFEERYSNLLRLKPGAVSRPLSFKDIWFIIAKILFKRMHPIIRILSRFAVKDFMSDNALSESSHAHLSFFQPVADEKDHSFVRLEGDSLEESPP